MNNVCYCDFHTHILPDIDDGAKNLDMSLNLLKMEIEQGVKQICFTPHFSADEDIDKFIEKRNKAYDTLLSKISEDRLLNIPKFYLGAEVALNFDTPDIDNLSKLCIGETDLILLEPPYTYWADWLPDVVYRIIVEKNLTPVIAHVDRYLDNKQCVRILNKLSEMNVLMQFNSYNLTNAKTRSLLKQIEKRGNIPLIGSDAHNPYSRTVTMNKTQSFKFKLLFGNDFIDNVNKQTKNILK